MIFDSIKSSEFLYFPVFLVGVVLRGIPELLVSWYPVGYETITWYAPVMTTFYGRSLIDLFIGSFRSGPLFYLIMWFVANLSGAHVFLILKVAGPLLYGGLAVSFFLFLKRGMRLDERISFVSTILLVFSPAALRISWDRFRNVLGLIFLFATLVALKSDHRYKWPFVAIFATLTALSREYIVVVLFAMILGFAFFERKNRTVSLAALAPALTIFAVMLYLAPYAPVWNYMSNGAPYSPGSYLWVVQDVLSIFAICYLPILPFVLKGYTRDKLLDPKLGWLLLGSFSVVAIPWFAVPGYQRWLMLMVFPFSIYAVKGFEHFRLFEKGNVRELAAIVLIFMVIGVGYSSSGFSYVVLPNTWVPTGLVQSSIAWNDVDDVKGVLSWLDENAVSNSSLLAEEKFRGWTMIYLGRASDDVKVFTYWANSLPESALEKALLNGFSWIYLIWYTDSNLENFQMIHSQNSISIFQYAL